MKPIVTSWYQTKIKYEKTMEDGVTKNVIESYVVPACSHTEAKERIREEMSSYVSGDVEVTSIVPAKYNEIFFSEDKDADKYYKAKLVFITLDEKTEKEKLTSSFYLVQAKSFTNAVENIQEVMKTSMLDYKIASVTETNILDVFVDDADY